MNRNDFLKMFGVLLLIGLMIAGLAWFAKPIKTKTSQTFMVTEEIALEFVNSKTKDTKVVYATFDKTKGTVSIPPIPEGWTCTITLSAK